VALLSDLTSRTRLELGDQAREFEFRAIGDGVTKEYYLNAKPVDPFTLLVTVSRTFIPAPTGYKLEVDTGILRFQTPIAAGEELKVNGIAYRYFSDADITRFITTAIEQHTYERTDAYGSRVTMATIPVVEEYPIAILATIEALWVLATDAAFDINITAPDGVVIPRSERYAQLTGMIAQRQEQYRSLCAQLNIGLWRIQVGNLRRASKRTNKLVPIYMPQEFDDGRKPERVYIQNDMIGRQTFPSTIQVQDLVMNQGDSYSQEFILGAPVTNLVFSAEIRTYPNSPTRWAAFDVTIVNAQTGRIRISLPQQETRYLPVRGFWDLQATSSVDDTFQITFLRGQTFVTQQVTTVE
jgi:hypothetical protein